MSQASFTLLGSITTGPGFVQEWKKKKRLHTVGDPAKPGGTPGVDAVTSMSQPAPPCQLRLGCEQETCSCRGRNAPSVSKCHVTLQGTGGAECALGCGPGNAHGLRNQTNCCVPMAGEVENIVLSFQQKKSFRLTSIIFYDSFPGSFCATMG